MLIFFHSINKILRIFSSRFVKYSRSVFSKPSLQFSKGSFAIQSNRTANRDIFFNPSICLIAPLLVRLVGVDGLDFPINGEALDVGEAYFITGSEFLYSIGNGIKPELDNRTGAHLGWAIS